MLTLHKLVEREADLYVFNNYLVSDGKTPQIEKNDCPRGDNHRGYVLSNLFKVRMNAVWDKVYRREILLPTERILCQKITFGDDMYLNYQYISSCKIQRVLDTEKQIYYHYIGTESSVSCRKSDMRRIKDTMICLTALQEAIKHYPEFNLLEHAYDFCYGYMVRHFHNMIRSGDDALRDEVRSYDFSTVNIHRAASFKGMCYRLALKYGLFKWNL